MDFKYSTSALTRYGGNNQVACNILTDMCLLCDPRCKHTPKSHNGVGPSRLSVWIEPHKIGAGLRIDCPSSDLGVDTVETREAPAHTHAIGCWTVITITCKLFCKRNSPGLYMVLMHAQLNCLIQDDVDNEMEHSNPSEEIHCAIPSIRIYRAMGEQISVVYVPQSSSFIMCVLIATHPTLPIISRLLMFTENVSSAVGRLAARDRR